MLMMLLTLMAGAVQKNSLREPAPDIQQVAIDAITGRSLTKAVREENRDEVRGRSDPQMEIADRIAGRNVTYPIAGEQSAKPVDMQSVIAASIGGKH